MGTSAGERGPSPPVPWGYGSITIDVSAGVLITIAEKEVAHESSTTKRVIIREIFRIVMSFPQS